MARVRRERLEQLIAERYQGKHTPLFEATGISLAQIGQWLNGGRAMSEASARDLEDKIGLSKRWLDGDQSTPPSANEPKAPYGIPEDLFRERPDVREIARAIWNWPPEKVAVLRALLPAIGPAVPDEKVARHLPRTPRKDGTPKGQKR